MELVEDEFTEDELMEWGFNKFNIVVDGENKEVEINEVFEFAE